jgi:hypothetical protein
MRSIITFTRCKSPSLAAVQRFDPAGPTSGALTIIIGPIVALDDIIAVQGCRQPNRICADSGNAKNSRKWILSRKGTMTGVRR